MKGERGHATQCAEVAATNTVYRYFWHSHSNKSGEVLGYWGSDDFRRISLNTYINSDSVHCSSALQPSDI